MFIAATLALALAGATPALVHAGEEGAYAAKLRAQAIAADTQFSGSRCDAARVASVHREDIKIVDRPDIAAARERVSVTGCGRSNIENISVARLDGPTPWTMAAALPGESLADMTLQKTALPQVIAKIAPMALAGCNAVTLKDIYVAARPGRVQFTNLAKTRPVSGSRFSISLPDELKSQQTAIDPAAAWVEVWPLDFCGKSRMAAVVFVPDREHRKSFFFVAPIWPQIETHGIGAKPAKD
jgi:hypothetical protein